MGATYYAVVSLIEAPAEVGVRFWYAEVVPMKKKEEVRNG
jgi:hypothetical protein